MRIPIFLFVAAIVGCGTDVTADQACAAVAASRCKQLMACSPADFSERWPDLPTCEARDKLACVEAQSAPKTAATPSQTDVCASEISASTCTSFLSGVMTPADCQAPTGPGADGSACEFSGQCSSAFCAIANDALCGTCAELPAAGASCASQGCGPTMICVATTQLCQAPVQAAGACNRDTPCGASLACVGATMAVMGTCVQRIATAGTACDPTRKTGPDCDPNAGLVCDSAMNVCVTQPIAATGQPCGAVGTSDTRCGGGATCVIPAQATVGVCVAPAADGAACDDTLGPSCQSPAACVGGTCQLRGTTSC
jgi:hypothetical protein